MRTRLRVFWRLFAVALWLIWGGLLALIFLKVDDQKGYASFQLSLVRWWSARLLAILGVRLSVQGALQHSSIWVANHISWLDIVVLMAIAPSRFLSKSEVANWPLIGWLAKRAGTVFIRRGSGESELVALQLKHLVELGDRVLFFPEGTSGGGEPLKFHARLFSLPVTLVSAVAPVALVYRDEKISPRADLAYVGEQTLMQSLTHLLAQPNLVAEVRLLPAIDAFDMSRKGLADAAHLSICTAWHEMTVIGHFQ